MLNPCPRAIVGLDCVMVAMLSSVGMHFQMLEHM